MAEARLSSRNQIVLPREVREALCVTAGDTVMFVVRENSVVVLQKPKSWAKALRGLAGRPYPANYVSDERDSWD